MNAFKVRQRAVSCSGHFLSGVYTDIDSGLKIQNSLLHKKMSSISCFHGGSVKWKANCSNLHGRGGGSWESIFLSCPPFLYHLLCSFDSLQD